MAAKNNFNAVLPPPKKNTRICVAVGTAILKNSRRSGAFKQLALCARS